MIIDWHVVAESEHVQLDDVKWKRRLNKLESFTIVVVNTEEYKRILDIDDTVGLYKDNKLKTNIVIKQRQITSIGLVVDGYQEGISINDTLYDYDYSQDDTKRIEHNNVAANTILGYILTGTGYAVGVCPSTSIPGVRYEYVGRLDAAIKLASILALDWWIDEDANTFNIGTRGSSKGEVIIADIKKTEDGKERIKTVHVLGSGDGMNQPKAVVTDADVTGKEVAISVRDVSDETQLANIGTNYINANNINLEKIPIEIDIDKAIWLNPGDTITVTSKEQEVVGDYRIKEIKIGTLEKATIQLSNVVDTFTEDQQTDKNDIKTYSVFEQGATNIYSYNGAENVDSGANEEITIDIYIPPETVNINHIKLSYKIQAFRAYSKSVASSEVIAALGFNLAHHVLQVGQHYHRMQFHTHDFSDGPGGHVHEHSNTSDDHIHDVDVPNYNVGDVTSDGPSGTTSVAHSTHRHRIAQYLAAAVGYAARKFNMWTSGGVATNIDLATEFTGDKYSDTPSTTSSVGSSGHTHDTSIDHNHASFNSGQADYSSGGKATLATVVSDTTDAPNNNDTNSAYSTVFTGALTITANTLPQSDPNIALDGWIVFVHLRNNSGGANTITYSVTDVTKASTIIASRSSGALADGDSVTYQVYVSAASIDDLDVISLNILSNTGYRMDEYSLVIMPISKHDHDLTITYGIFEASLGSPTVDVKIDGSTRYSGLSGDQVDKVLDTWITTTGWHIVKLLPSSQCRLHWTIFNQIFIRST